MDASTATPTSSLSHLLLGCIYKPPLLLSPTQHSGSAGAPWGLPKSPAPTLGSPGPWVPELLPREPQLP